MQFRRMYVSALMAACALGVFSQILDVKEIRRVETAIPVDQAVLSPDGTMAVVSSLDGFQLSRVNLADGQSSIVTDNAIIHDLKWTDDGRQIVYLRPSYDANNLRYKAVVGYDVQSGSTTELAAPTRNLRGVAVRGSRAMIVRAGEKRRVVEMRHAQASEPAAADAAPIAYISRGQLMLSVDGRDVALNPHGKEGHSYLWPSISPDGAKVLFYHVGTGAHVCDLDGSNVIDLGRIHAPRWLDSATVIGMDDYDDGEVFTRSSIVAADLNGNRQNLTSGLDAIALYPSASRLGDRIGFTTPRGELYIIDINR